MIAHTQAYSALELGQKLYQLRFVGSLKFFKKKSRIRETKHFSTNADSSTDAIGGWTKNSKNPIFLTNGKNHQKLKNSETSRNMVQIAESPQWLSGKIYPRVVPRILRFTLG